MNEIKERGILFSAPMVRALLREIDLKWQTRRTSGLKALNNGYYRNKIERIEFRCGNWCFWDFNCGSSALPVFTAKCPYGTVGDRLWVKETFQLCEWFQDHWEPASLRHEAQSITKCYAADGSIPQDGIPWRPSIFMPRWASRITLEITNVRVQRLQEISEEDANAEGVESSESVEMKDGSPCYTIPYQILWNQINGTGSWEKNPWVWAISFRRIRV